MIHLIKRRPLPALSRPLLPPAQAEPELSPAPAWREDVRDFFVAYVAGLIAFGLMLA